MNKSCKASNDASNNNIIFISSHFEIHVRVNLNFLRIETVIFYDLFDLRHFQGSMIKLVQKFFGLWTIEFTVLPTLDHDPRCASEGTVWKS